MVLAVLEDNGKPDVKRSYTLVNGEQLAGRSLSCQIILADPTVSAEHAKLTLKGNELEIRDLNSTNGIFVNGEKIEVTIVKPDTKFRIGNVGLLFAEKIISVQLELDTEKRRKLHEEIVARLNADRVGLVALDKESLGVKTREAAEAVLRAEFGADGASLVDTIVADMLGLGPLEPLLADKTVSEIMVNGPDSIFAERNGKLTREKASFASERHVRDVIERIVLPLGRRIDDGSPVVDARLKDGSRVNAVIPPLALDGPIITIRKFSSKKLTPEDLIRFNSADEQIIAYLKSAVEAKRNIVISGGTGSGKTTLLNIIASFIPANERIVTIEDAAELTLPGEHVVRLESRPPNIEGKGAVTIRDLVKNALRMRPDRIVVGECRGGEALDMLQAMNTGHDGSLTTGHANTPLDMIRRLEIMVLLSGIDLPVRAIREQIAFSVHLIVQQSRLPDGRRKITSVTEVLGMDGEWVKIRELFKYDYDRDIFIATQV